MKTMINVLSGLLLTLATYSASAADAQSIRHEIEQFFTSGVGSIVLIILMLLFLLWLLLPLAVFGLKSKLNTLIRENQNLTGDSKETIKILSAIRDELAALSKEVTTITYTDQSESASDEDLATDLIQGNYNLHRDSDETNKILADIRDILAALNAEQAAEDYSEQAERADTDDVKPDYDEVKFDP